MRQPELYFPNSPQLTDKDRRWIVDPSNPECPLHSIVGNPHAVQLASTYAYDAWCSDSHSMGGVVIAWIGQAGVGKTMFARKLAETVRLPFIDVNTKEAPKVSKLVEKMDQVLERYKTSSGDLRMRVYENGQRTAPSCIVFVDEFQDLAENTVQGLLTATEKSTHRMADKGVDCDTKRVCWMFATTEWGNIFHALRSRCTPIRLHPYTREELAKIVHLQFPQIPMDACEAITFYSGGTTRSSLKIAELTDKIQRMQKCSWGAAVERARTLMGIDSHGMTEMRLKAIQALAYGPLSREALAGAVGCEVAELVKEIMPPLRETATDTLPFVQTGSRGFYLTEEGVRELEKRRIRCDPSAAVLRRRRA